MPTVLSINGFRFYFFSNENNEPMHIHIEKAGANAKIWLDPYKVEYFYDFTTGEQRQIKKITEEHLETFKSKWHEYFK